MLAAEIYGKVSNQQSVIERMEDVLTSYVLSIFRYLDNLRIPLSFLSQARNLDGDLLQLENVNDLELYFWPMFSFPGKGNREPDALIVFNECNSPAAIVIEAKYWSGLSNVVDSQELTDEIMEQQTSIKYGHQLADQYCGLHCGNWSNVGGGNDPTTCSRKMLIYLTSSYVMPQQDLWDAVKEVKSRTCYKGTERCGPEPEKQFFWLSWRELYSIIEDEKKACFPNLIKSERLLLEDLQKVLTKRDLVPFTVWQHVDDVEAYERFWKRKTNVSPGLMNSINEVDPYRSWFGNRPEENSNTFFYGLVNPGIYHNCTNTD